ncbi:hypothetical protein ATCV1_z434R [Acanthocystis turfacea chlorella virus 1]|uniref:Uncharacterized protein z434R n=1 Tax=Chlorovirus heliozoae TaxID=322019 RepID=A7K944_9PHYC|nr:hypothetical protein ATCV1_z434R [Acanthocystis turfacea chlorella virus 1]ABT16568.1 hypothetical protein ATCV1_z434R [Acanthocystis turfacea chlorella virus 1]
MFPAPPGVYGAIWTHPLVILHHSHGIPALFQHGCASRRARGRLTLLVSVNMLPRAPCVGHAIRTHPLSIGRNPRGVRAFYRGGA